MLDKARSANDVKAIAKLCAENPDDFQYVLSCLRENGKSASMVAWVLGHAVELNPLILMPSHYDILIQTALKSKTGGVKRNIVRIWQLVEIPNDRICEIVDITLKYLNGANEDIAVKAFSITVLQHCLKYIPELQEEIIFILEKDMPQASPAYVHRAKKLLKFAEKLDRARQIGRKN